MTTLVKKNIEGSQNVGKVVVQCSCSSEKQDSTWILFSFLLIPLLPSFFFTAPNLGGNNRGENKDSMAWKYEQSRTLYY